MENKMEEGEGKIVRKRSKLKRIEQLSLIALGIVLVLALGGSVAAFELQQGPKEIEGTTIELGLDRILVKKANTKLQNISFDPEKLFFATVVRVSPETKKWIEVGDSVLLECGHHKIAIGESKENFICWEGDVVLKWRNSTASLTS